LSISSWSRMRVALPPGYPPITGSAAGSSSAAIASHSAAARSPSLRSSVSGESVIAAPLLNQHFLEQDVLVLDGRRHRVHPKQQLLPKPVEAGGSLQVLDAKLAQIDLEGVHDPRQDQLDVMHGLGVGELEA